MRKPSKVDKPDIIFYMHDPASDGIVMQKINEVFDNIYAFTDAAEFAPLLKTPKPKLILVSGEKVTQCLSVFYNQLNKVTRSSCCRYRLLILVPKYSEKAAYQTFKNGLIDDYLVSKPLYELHRPITLCHHLLEKLNEDQEIDRELNWGNPTLQRFSEDLRALIDGQEEKIANREKAIKQEVDTFLKVPDKAPAYLIEYINNQAGPALNKIKQESVVTTREVIETFKDLATDFINKNITDSATEKAKPRALIVDADINESQHTRNIVEKSGFIADRVHTGRGCLDYVEHHEYAMFLLDKSISDTYLSYVATLIKRHSNYNDQAPVILLTHEDTRSLSTLKKEYRVDGVSFKPLSKSAFLSIIQEHLSTSPPVNG